MRKWYVLFLLMIVGLAGFSSVIPAVAQELSQKGSRFNPAHLFAQATPPPQGTPPPATTPPPGSPQGTPPPVTTPPPGGGGEPQANPAGGTGTTANPMVAPDGAPNSNLTPTAPDLDARLPRYGDAFFNVSRRAISQARAQIATGTNASAFAGPSGPINLGNVGATPPETYQLGAGDKLTLRVASSTLDPVESKLTVDSLGYITIPQSGKKIVVVGQTLATAEKLVGDSVKGYVRNAQVSLSLDELRTFTVTILGESYAPGAYQVPATFTLFNLILATGGPSDRGSLRNIQLRRNNLPMKTFDLYRFLILGDAKQDTPLQPGDVVFYTVQRGQVEVSGEVNRPASYELKGGEELSTVLSFAGGIRPSGVSQNVAIDSVVPGYQRKLLNVNVTKKAPASNPVVYDGDRIQVFSIRSDIRNSVSIEGPVELPRTYAYQKGMRVSALVTLARGLLPAADKSVAELKRMNPDGSRKLVRVDLAAALKGVLASDIELMPEDALKIFDVNDVAWRGDRQVRISGAVRSPDTFYRADGMRLVDLIRAAKGLTPEAFTQEARIQRYLPDGTPDVLIRVDLLKAALGDSQNDILLQDRDQVRIFKLADWQDQVVKSVEVTGAVQRPGKYPLASNMTVKDLIQLAGNLALNANSENAFLQRINDDGTLGPVILISPSKVIANDPSSNVALKPRDVLKVYTNEEWRATPAFTVELSGAVQRPGTFGLAKGMTIRDLVNLAGGPTLDAYLSQAFLQRINLDGTLGALVLVDVNKALAGDSTENRPLESRDKLTIYRRSQAKVYAQRVVRILGGVQRPGEYPRGEGMTLASLIDIAGGLLPNSEKFALIAASDAPEGQDVDRVAVESAATRLIRDKDLVTVPIDSSILAEPIQVVIQGAVKNPGTYFFTRKDQRFTDLVKQAGGLRSDAWVNGIQFARRPDLLKTNAQVSQQPRLLEVLNIVQTNEYKRAVAKAQADRLVFLAGASAGASPFGIPSIGGSSVQGAAAAAGALSPPSADGAGELVTPARQGNDLFSLIGGNMDIRAESAFRNPNSTENVVLKPGDVVTVPDLPSTVLVDGPGAVLPRAFVFQPGQSLRDYIVKAGGVTSDADTDRIIILRPTGSITRPSPGTRIELGDVIYVPTKVMISPLGGRGDVFDRTVKTITSAALIYGIFRSLVK